MASKPSYAQVAVSKVAKLKRPNCLSMKAEGISRRDQLLEMLAGMEFPTKKLLGVAEMRGNSFDVTCTSRPNALELYGKLCTHELIKYVRLYESDKINVAIGWVPIPFPNEDIAEELSTKYGSVIKMIHRKGKEGLLTGMRIATMNSSELEQHPIPSYITVKNCEFYVTYHGQVATCKYCEQAGHKQADCPKRKEDYPELEIAGKDQRKQTRNSSLAKHSTSQAPGDTAAQGATLGVSSADIGDKGAKAQLSDNVANGQSNEPRGSDEPNSSTPVFPKINRKRIERSPEELPSSKSISLCENVSSLHCLDCNDEVLISTHSKTTKCWTCSKEWRVALKCCKEELFLLDMKKQTCKCPACHNAMRFMPCCREIQPEFQLEEGIFECVQCERIIKTLQSKQRIKAN